MREKLRTTTAVMDAMQVPCLGPGRPRVRLDHVIGDKGYGSKEIRAWLRRWGVSRTIAERSDQIRYRLRRGHRGGRAPAFDKYPLKRRNVVELMSIAASGAGARLGCGVGRSVAAPCGRE
ncbi:transposase [Streptomyces sp. NPDC059680]|uniref:transposase n=1 Tax=Streptomyces sp. NPDC059680 TaxID=3346904 RepID=UPI0036CEB0D9